MKEFIDEFMNYLSVERGLAKNTLLAYRRDLEKYIDYLSQKGIKTAGTGQPRTCFQFYVRS